MTRKMILAIIFMMSIMIFLPASSSLNSNIKIIGESMYPSIYDSWPMFRHDLEHTGYSTSPAPNTNTTLWSFIPVDTIPPIYELWLGDSSPAIMDGKVYIGVCSDEGLLPTAGYVYCLDEFSGEEIWSRKTDGWMMSSPAVSGNKVYVGSLYYSLLYNGTVYCLDSADGSIIWTYKTIYKIYSSPAVYNQKVYFGSTDLDLYNSKGEIVCVNSNNGDLIWKYIPEKGILSSPAISNGRLYIGCMDGKVYCLNAENGEHIWNNTIGGRIRSSPSIYENKVYIGSIMEDTGKLFCLNAENGNELWNYTTICAIGASPAVGYDKVYIGTHYSQSKNKASFYCLDALSGTKIWNFTTQLSIVSSASIADSKVYIGLGGSFNASSGNVVCVDALDGNLVWEYKTNRPVTSSPAIRGDKLFVNSYEGSLYCFCDDLPPAKPSTPSGPIIVGVGISYNYSTSTTDPDGDMVRYGWDWNNDKVVDEWTDFYQSGITVTKSHTWQNMGFHIVRVRAEDDVGIQSQWSNPLIVVMSQVHEQQMNYFAQKITIKNNIA